MALEGDALERYARHIVLREIGGPGQARLGAAQVLVVGAGGLGAPALLYLAAAGIGRIRVVDDDVVALSNLQRQVLFQTRDVDRDKVVAAAAAIHRLNPLVAVEPIVGRFSPETATSLTAGVDLVLDGVDDPATRRSVNATATALGVPLISGAVGPWDGQVGVFDPRRGGPCYACAFPTDPPAAPSCAEGGIVGALTGVIGAMMALEAIKRLAGVPRPPGAPADRAALLLYDALTPETRIVAVRRRGDCRVCGAVARRA